MHPNRYLNEFAAQFALTYLRNIGYEVTGSRINTATWRFLKNADIPATSDIWSLGDLAHQAAIVQKRLVMEGRQNTSLRSVRHEYPQLMPIISHGPQAWLINTYRPLLENLLEVDLGVKKYGIHGDVYRVIRENVMAARMMFETASNQLANKIVELYREYPHLAVVEGGAGNGAATLTTLKQFHDVGVYPEFLITDIDPETKDVSEAHFRSHGFKSKYFPWLKLDIGSTDDLYRLTKSFPYHHLVFNANFILHEWEPIADSFFQTASSSMPQADLVISEFFVPEDAEDHPDFPWWFVYLHEISDQKLRTEAEFMSIPRKYGYQLFDRLDYQTLDGKPVVSTLFFNQV